MKTELNFLELHFLIEELQELIGGRIDNIYQPNGLILQIHKSGKGKQLLQITDKAMFLAKEKPETEKPTALCSTLRKYLKGKKITEIKQINSERIAKITLQTQKEKFHLFIELFSNGNMVLTDENQKILAAKEERAWKDREIRRGKTYQLPPQKQNLFELTEVPKEEKELASAGFGKLLAKEIIARGSYRELLKEKKNPRIYSDGEMSPIKLEQYKETGKTYKTFSEILDKYLTKNLQTKKEEKASRAYEQKRAKMQEIIDVQTKTKEEQEKKAIEQQRKGELIYEHYQELKEILEEINKAKA
ncbi:NFACT family protein, partial [Candidatus Woesearchaeota archaeon]|nr:NFACT family protein [Candidatus Woesearchaeota archaeon]